MSAANDKNDVEVEKPQENDTSKIENAKCELKGTKRPSTGQEKDEDSKKVRKEQENGTYLDSSDAEFDEEEEEGVDIEEEEDENEIDPEDDDDDDDSEDDSEYENLKEDMRRPNDNAGENTP